MERYRLFRSTLGQDQEARGLVGVAFACVLAMMFLVLFPDFALAQAVAAAEPSVLQEANVDWITPLLNASIAALVPIIGVLGGFVVWKLNTWLNGKIDENARNAIMAGATNMGQVIAGKVIAYASDGKITGAELGALVRDGASSLLKTYSDSAARLEMTTENAVNVVQGAAVEALKAHGLMPDLDTPGVLASVPKLLQVGDILQDTRPLGTQP